MIRTITISALLSVAHGADVSTTCNELKAAHGTGQCCHDAVDLDAKITVSLPGASAPSMRAAIRSKFTAAQLASWDLSGTTINTGYSPYVGDLQHTPFGVSGKVVHHYAVIEALTGATINSRNDGLCAPHYNLYTDGYQCQTHFGWFDSASRVEVTEGKAFPLSLAKDDFVPSTIYIHKSRLSEARNALSAALDGRSPTEITYGIGRSVSDPYFATKALMSAGFKFVHTGGSACHDNIGHVDHGNVTYTADNSVIIDTWGGYTEVIDGFADKRGFTIIDTPSAATLVNFTSIDLGGDVVVGCKTYYDTMWIVNEHLEASVTQKLQTVAEAAAAAGVFEAGRRFSAEQTPCTIGDSGMTLGSVLNIRLDTTRYCDEPDLLAHDAGTSIVY